MIIDTVNMNKLKEVYERQHVASECKNLMFDDLKCS